MLMLVNIRSYA